MFYLSTWAGGGGGGGAAPLKGAISVQMKMKLGRDILWVKIFSS